jgi:hypothetical protein
MAPLYARLARLLPLVTKCNMSSMSNPEARPTHLGPLELAEFKEARLAQQAASSEARFAALNVETVALRIAVRHGFPNGTIWDMNGKLTFPEESNTEAGPAKDVGET